MGWWKGGRAEGPLLIRDKMKRICIPFQVYKLSPNRFVIEVELDVDRHAFDLSAYGRLIGGMAKVVLSAVYEQYPEKSAASLRV